MHLIFIFGYIFLEIYSLVLLSDVIGGLFTLVWVFAAIALGLWLIREQGRENLNRMMMGVQQGSSPQESLLDSVFVLLAGLLLIIPGLISDALALLLLIPRIRRLFFGKTVDFMQSKGPQFYARNTVFFTRFGAPYNASAGGEHPFSQSTMDAEYVVREQSPRQTTAVVIDTAPLDGGTSKNAENKTESEKRSSGPQ